MKLNRRSFLTLLGISPIILSVPIDFDPGEIVYKIVTQNDCSINYGLPTDIRLHYSTEKFTYPKIGQIFCFTDLEAVKRYPHKLQKVYKAKAYGVKLGKMLCSDYSDKIEHIEKYWAGKNSLIGKIYAFSDLEPSTRFCNSLKLLEEVNYNETF